MERLQKAGVALQLLNVQYRMPPEVVAWPNARFYEGRLSTAPAPCRRAGWPT